MLDTGIREELPDLGDHETTTFPRLAEAGNIYAYPSRAFWKAVDNLKERKEAEEAVAELGMS